MVNMSKEIALNWIDDNEKKIIELSDKAWEYAELGLLEYKTSKLWADEIENQGFSVERGVADMPTAFTAEWGSGKPVIGILGELDALAGCSQKAVPYKDPVVEGGPGHGCGHNIYGASGLAGAVALKIVMESEKIPGTIKYYGCPAEETLVGKVWMVRHSLFEGVDAVISHHPGSANTAGLRSSNAMNSVKFHFYGRTSHAAGDPENGISALDAVELMADGVNYMREHVIDKARIHYITEVGGGQPNVVPGYARTWYYVRAPEREQVDYIYNWVLEIADGADKMARTKHEVEFLTGCYNRITNNVLSQLVVRNMQEIGAPKFSEEDVEFAEKLSESIPREMKRENLRKSQRPEWDQMIDDLFDERILDAWDEGMVGTGSADTGDVTWVTPVQTFSTTCQTLGTPGHSWQFTAQTGMGIGHKGLIFASKVIALTGLDLLMDPDLVKNAQSEWRKRLQGRSYKPAIPLDLKPPLDQLK